MPLLLLPLAGHPGEIAATRRDPCLPDGAIFLDFSRPPGRLRFCGVWNRWIGTILALNVPGIHEGEAGGWRTIRGPDLRPSAWSINFASKPTSWRSSPTTRAA